MKERKMEDVQLNLFEEDDGKKSIKENQDEQTANFLNNTSVTRITGNFFHQENSQFYTL